jgi:aminoglycoside phosphotransferase (APT) family kinase protein
MTQDDTVADSDPLRGYLADELGPGEGFAVRPLEGGNANETLLVEFGGRELVLRRPPAVEPAPGVLHNPRREYRLLDALGETWVPTPGAVLYCADESVLGDPFVLMERVAGDVLDSDPPERFRHADARRGVGAETVDGLAKIHHLDPDRLGLDDLDRSSPARQVEIFSDQLAWAQERTAEARDLPVLFEVADWLADNAPDPGHTTLVHGDYKPDNLVFGPDSTRLAGVLDWEMAGLGDPLADLGWLLSYWAEARDPSPITDDLRDRYADHEQFPILQVFVEEYAGYMTHPGYHSRRELVDRYERQTGIEYTDDRFYRALGAFKLAALCEGFFRTYLEGAPNAKDSYPAMELIVPALGRKARQVIEGERPL